MARDPIPTGFFVVTVVRHDDHFLIVRERKHGQLWYLPAGRVELGEDLVAAACRETLEEAGISIEVTGIIRIEHTPKSGYARVRVVFTGVPIGETKPKSIPDDESLGAAWITVDELSGYALRGRDVEDVLRYIAAGGLVYPLGLLQHEGMPYHAN